MNASLNIGKPFGFDVTIHWSFWLVVLWAGSEGWRWSGRWQGAVFAVIAILLFFVCVLLHELGHIWVAKAYGVAVAGIVLLPVGGVAKIRQMPDKAWQELTIALAGPLVNLAIAMGLLILHLLVWGTGMILGFIEYTETVIPGIMASIFGGGSLVSLVAFLILSNFLLAVFNLIPAFPMDGGRIFRAFMAMAIPYRTATRVAVRTGQALALVTIFFALTPFFGTQSLGGVLIAVFVLVGATYEDKLVQSRWRLAQRHVAEVMSDVNATTISPDDNLGLIMERVFKTPQLDLPVMAQGLLTGMLRRDDLLTALQQGKSHLSVGDIMRTDYPTVEPTDTLQTVQHHMVASKFTTLPVLKNSTLVGLINIRDVNGVA